MKIGRNAPCPCGSGKKYKTCCIRLDKANRGLPGGAPVRQAASKARVWQADLLPVPIRLEDDLDARPAALLVIASGFVISSEMLSRPSPEVDAIAAELSSGILAAIRAVGSAPAEIAVREPEVAAALAELLATAGHVLAVKAAPLPELEAAMASLNQSMGGPARAFVGSRPDTWRGWGQPDAWIAEFFGRCAAYYRAAPWRHFDDFPPILASTPEGREWLLSVLGSGDVEYGLGFYSALEDYKRVLDNDLSTLTGRILGMTFESARDLERPMRKEVAGAGWDVASPDAYPVLLALGCPAGGLRSTDAADLSAILAAFPPWIKAIDLDPDLLDEEIWTDPETGVTLEWANDEVPISKTG